MFRVAHLHHPTARNSVLSFDTSPRVLELLRTFPLTVFDLKTIFLDKTYIFHTDMTHYNISYYTQCGVLRTKIGSDACSL